MLMILLPLISTLLLMLLLPINIMWISFIIITLIVSIPMLTKLPMMNMLTTFMTNLDSMSLALMLLTLWITAAMLIASQPILQRKTARTFMIYVAILMLVLLLSFSTSQMISFYIYFEASLIPTLLLILGWGYQPERLQAGLYLILYTVTASLPLLFSITKMLYTFHHLSFTLPFWQFYSTMPMASVWWFLTIVAFLVKTPLFLVHLWLPKAHVEAPVAGSMVLAGILLKLGSYGLLRLSTKMIMMSKTLSTPFMVVCTMGGALASLICIRQTDVKSLIAYSSVSHMGLATGGIMSNTSWGWQGALTMLIAHGFCSSSMFSLANMTYETTQSRSMYLTSGFLTMFPSLTFWWFCFSACNMAAPPSINLASEILLITANMSFSLMNFIPASIMAFMAAAYSLMLYTSTQHGTPPQIQHPLQLLTPRNYTVAFLHFIPIIFFIMKIEPVTQWI